jgi:hypothetical protein
MHCSHCAVGGRETPEALYRKFRKSPILPADSHDAAKLGCPWGCVKGGISYEDFTYFYQLVSTSHGGM